MSEQPEAPRPKQEEVTVQVLYRVPREGHQLIRLGNEFRRIPAESLPASRRITRKLFDELEDPGSAH